MITIDDALNRNYYFYQGSGEVRVDFVKAVFEELLGYDYQKFIDKRAKPLIKKGWNSFEAKEKARHMAVETCLRACEAIPKYREEIIEKFTKEPGLRGGISDVKINHMKYTELNTLRTNLGLNKRGKKVTKQEPAPKKTVEQAKKSIKARKTSETAKDIIVNKQPTLEDVFPEVFHPTEEVEREESFLTVAEARLAYTGYSLDELESLGIHIIEEDAREKLETLNTIDEILEYDITIDGERVTEESLLTYGLVDLNAILKYVRHLNKVNKTHKK